MPDLTAELRLAVEHFLGAHEAFLAGRSGRRARSLVHRFGESTGWSRRASPDAPIPDDAARAMLDWVDRLPSALLSRPGNLALDRADPDIADYGKDLVSGLHFLVAGARALLLTGTGGQASTAERIVAAAFGGDPASRALKEPFSPEHAPGLPDLPDLGGLGAVDLARLIVEGTLRDLLATFATCGEVARQEAAWVAAARPFGRVTALSPARACAGASLVIGFAGFGRRMAADLGDVMLSLPTRSGCRHLSLRQIAADLFLPGGWRDAGHLTVILPDDIYTGPVGFWAVPPPVQSAGCAAGGLAAAAGQFQSILGSTFGSYGVQLGQGVVDVALQAQAGMHRPLPCAEAQSDQVNWLVAGPPVIDLFQVIDPEPRYPVRQIRLRWSVANADQITITARAVRGSINRHELPTPVHVTGPAGEVVLNVQATRRWEGDYVLQARNANGCSAQPVTASVRVTACFSLFRSGVAKVDITNTEPGLPLLGFSDDAQRTSGRVDLPLFARAFAVAENRPGARPLVMVVCDLWGSNQMLKSAVIERLNRGRNPPPYSDENLLIGATHTHAAMGGYYEYFLYNFAGGGFIPRVFERLVEAIAFAVAQAVANMRPGEILMTAGQITGCGDNRSFEAYLRNPEAQPRDPSHWVDREMVLLKFLHDRDNRGNADPVGCLNWHALHPTSLGMFNDMISGDSKGWAAKLFEDAMGAGFVAGFANAAAGDVSGNVTQDADGHATIFKPMAKPGDTAALRRDHDRMHLLAERQFQQAMRLFHGAREALAGPLQMIHQHIDMSNVAIAGLPGARTWPAAMGVSFGAGSSEDGEARAELMGQFIGSHIYEGYTLALRTLGAIEFATLVFPAAVGLVGAIVTGAPAVLVSTAASPATVAAVIASFVPGPNGSPPLVVTVAPDVLVATIEALLTVLPRDAVAFLTSSIAVMVFPTKVAERSRFPTGTASFVLRVDGFPLTLAPDFAAGHAEKPIMMVPGLARVTRSEQGVSVDLPCPLVPHVVPHHLIRIGQLALAGVPAEFTSTAGRRLKAAVGAALGPAITRTAVFGYANAYSGYVTTPEEYAAQHYEGASTLYGPHTLAAYLQEFTRLAGLMSTGAPAPATPAFVPPTIFRRDPPFPGP